MAVITINTDKLKKDMTKLRIKNLDEGKPYKILDVLDMH